MKEDRTVESLLKACEKGELPAQEALYKRYVKAMLNTSYRILNNREDAEDAVQEAFVKAFRNIKSFKGNATFGAWLKRIVINQSINILKKRKGEEVDWDEKTQCEWDQVTPTLDHDPIYTVDEAYHALHELSDGYRTIFSLYALEGYDHQEIASIMGNKSIYKYFPV